MTFDIGTDLNAAQILVQNRLSSALSSLPQSVQVQGVVVQKRSTARIVMISFAVILGVVPLVLATGAWRAQGNRSASRCSPA